MSENAFWTQTRERFRKKRPEEYPFFKTWDEVGAIPIYNPFETYPEYQREVDEWISKMGKKAKKTWLSALEEPEYGHTAESLDLARGVMEASDGPENSTTWAYKSAHHVATYEKMSGTDITKYDRIFEFGAGIGDTARFIHDLGFKGRYEILDSAEIGAVSSNYLKSVGYPNVVMHKNLSTVKSIKEGEKTLFIGTWSLSEVPFEYRVETLKKFKRADFLVIYQRNVFEYSNESWFLYEFPILTETFYRLKEIESHAGQGGNFYIVSTPRTPI